MITMGVHITDCSTLHTFSLLLTASTVCYCGIVNVINLLCYISLTLRLTLKLTLRLTLTLSRCSLCPIRTVCFPLLRHLLFFYRHIH